MLHKVVKNISALLATAAMLLSGCGPTAKEWQPEKDTQKVYSVAANQLAPEPVYNRQRWVYLPEPLPSRELPDSDAPEIRPVFHMQLKNTKLEEVARLLAATARYNSYCNSSIADKKISIDTLGTIDELAEAISTKANIHVTVDHNDKQVRFLVGNADAESSTSPKFSSDRTN